MQVIRNISELYGFFSNIFLKTLHARELFQSHWSEGIRSKQQASLTAGTVSEQTKLVPGTRHLVMYLLVRSKNGISAGHWPWLLTRPWHTKSAASATDAFLSARRVPPGIHAWPRHTEKNQR